MNQLNISVPLTSYKTVWYFSNLKRTAFGFIYLFWFLHIIYYFSPKIMIHLNSIYLGAFLRVFYSCKVHYDTQFNYVSLPHSSEIKMHFFVKSLYNYLEQFSYSFLIQQFLATMPWRMIMFSFSRSFLMIIT